MAFAQVAGLSDPLEDYPGYWLKFYEQGTATPLSMATDATGGTLLAKAEISSGGTAPIGFIKTAGDAIFIPFVDGFYDGFLIPTEAEADANDLTNAVQIADNINADPGQNPNFSTDSQQVTYTAPYASSVQNTVEGKLSECISVFDFMTTAEIADVKAGTLTLDVTAAFLATAAAAATRSKHVFAPAGNYLTGPLLWPGLVGLFGEGMFSTILTLAAGSDASHLQLTSTTSYFNILRDFSMAGNSANQTGTSHGLNLEKTAAGGITSSGNHRITNVWVKDYLNHGVNVGGFSNGTIFERVFCNFNLQFGFNNFAGDVVFSNSQAFNNELTGFNEQGVGTQYSNCKSWLNGANGQPTGSNHLHGWHFRAGARNIALASCISQENWGHGFFFDQCQGVTGAGLVADGNSITVIQAVSTQRLYDGFHFTDADDCVLTGHCGQFYIVTNATWLTQRFGVYVDDLSENNSIDVGVIQHDAQTRGGTTGEYFLDAAGTLNNKVIVRGNILTMPDVVSTVTDASVSDEQLYGTTLLNAPNSFTQVTVGAGATVPPSGVTKTYRTINAANAVQIVINNYIHGILTLPMSTGGDVVVLRSNGFKWVMIYGNVAGELNVATTAELDAIGNTINTSDKYTGKVVLNTTSNTIVAAAGGATGSLWVAAGATAHTPA